MVKEKCRECENKEATIKQFSPDFGTMFFCSIDCLNSHQFKYCYRSSPPIDLATGQELKFKKKDIIDILNESKELKRAFDLWALNFSLKDGCGGRPDLFSMLHSCQYVLRDIFKNL